MINILKSDNAEDVLNMTDPNKRLPFTLGPTGTWAPPVDVEMSDATPTDATSLGGSKGVEQTYYVVPPAPVPAPKHVETAPDVEESLVPKDPMEVLRNARSSRGSTLGAARSALHNLQERRTRGKSVEDEVMPEELQEDTEEAAEQGPSRTQRITGAMVSRAQNVGTGLTEMAGARFVERRQERSLGTRLRQHERNDEHEIMDDNEGADMTAERQDDFLDRGTIVLRGDALGQVAAGDRQYETEESTELEPYVQPPIYKFRQRRAHAALATLQDEAAEMWAENAGYEGEVELDINDLRTDVIRGTTDEVRKRLPPAILFSPASRSIVAETRIRGGTFFVGSADEIDDILHDDDLPPATRLHRRNEGLIGLRDESIAHAVGKVIVDLSPLELANRVADALTPEAAGMLEQAAPAARLTIHHFSANDGTYVDAMPAAEVVEKQSKRGGLIPARSDEEIIVSRVGFEPEKTFRSSVSMVQDRKDPDVTLVFALEPGYAPMAGAAAEGDKQRDYGLLRLSGVALKARNFERTLHEELNEPYETVEDMEGTAGLVKITEVRRRTDLVDGVSFLTDPRALGVVSENIRRKKQARALEAGDADESVHDAELVD